MIKRLIGWIAALATLFAVAAALRCGEYRSMLSLRAERTEASAGVPGGTSRSGAGETSAREAESGSCDAMAADSVSYR